MEKFNELIDFAIEEERKAYDLYSKTAEKVEGKSASEMLKSMANMEKGHEAKLKAFKENRIEKWESEKVRDLKIGDYLVDFLGVRPSGQTSFLCPPHLGGGDHFHGPGNLGYALYAAYPASDSSNVSQSVTS